MGAKSAEPYAVALRLFENEVYASREGKPRPLLCNIHDVFETWNSPRHNCLGCNFADLTIEFKAVLKTLATRKAGVGSFYTYLLWLNLFIDRYRTLAQLAGARYAREEDCVVGLSPYNTILRWTNFVKHPKAFMLSHHPEFVMTLPDGTMGPAAMTIDTDFVVKYFRNKDTDDELKELLTNRWNVRVVYPAPVLLMEEFVEVTKSFLALVGEEPFRTNLMGLTTAPDIWMAARS